MSGKSFTKGFTIVELLIVVVVIAILASITVVAYSGVSQKAYNSSVISSARQAMSAVRSYYSVHGETLPIVTTDFYCITSASGCYTNSAPGLISSELDSLLGQYGGPKTVAIKGADRYGVLMHSSPNRKVDGATKSTIIVYYLQGVEQDCGLDPVVTYVNGVDDLLNLQMSTDRYTHANAGGKTACFISI